MFTSKALGVKAAQTRITQTRVLDLNSFCHVTDGSSKRVVGKDAMTQANIAIRALYDEG